MLRFCSESLAKSPLQRIHAIYDCLAPLYFVLHPFVRSVARSAVALLPDGTSRQALDLCTGTGVLAEALAGRGCAVTGIDLSAPMLSQRRKARAARGIASIRMDARHLGFADASFDVCAISMGLHEFPTEERAQILSEMMRVSRRYVLVADYSGKQPWFIRLAERLEASHFRDFVDQSLADQLTQAGLRVVKQGRWHSVGMCLCEVPSSLP
jgi:ubiquinone/menaquinone biosynthesis C-methylase UbiE